MIAVIPAVSAGRNSEQRRKKHAESENLRQGQNITGNSFHGGIFHGEEIYGTLLLAAVAENINFTGGWGGTIISWFDVETRFKVIENGAIDRTQRPRFT